MLTEKLAHILLRLDANHHIGVAHAVRTSALLALLKTSHRVSVVGVGEPLAMFFPDATIDPLRATNFLEVVMNLRPDLVMVDHPATGPGFWRALANADFTVPVVAIDDEGGDVDADLVINGTVLEQYHQYPGLRSSAMRLIGPRHALLRPQFSVQRWHDPVIQNVLVIVGSGDRACEWSLKIKRPGNCARVRMIVGTAYPKVDALKRHCATYGIELMSGLSGAEMATAMSQASVVLITGGMIVYEALAIGVPAVVFPQMPNLPPEAAWFAGRGCIVDLGYDGGMNQQATSDAVEMLLSSQRRRSEMSKAQVALVDGGGLQRAADAVDRLLAERHVGIGLQAPSRQHGGCS